MNDIEKMRQEMEQKLEFAEIENEMERKLGFDSFRITGPNKDGSLHVYFSDLNHQLSLKDAAKVLTMMPWTEETVVSNTDHKLHYLLITHKNPKECATTLTIKWRHNNFEISMDVKIRTEEDFVKAHFVQTEREISNDEVALWYGSVSYQARANLRKVRFLTFNSGQVIRYQGGYHYQVSPGVSDAIVYELIGE